MNQKNIFLIAVIGIVLLLTAAFVMYFVKLPNENANLQKTSITQPKVLDVDEVVRHPERFKGSIGVVGG